MRRVKNKEVMNRISKKILISRKKKNIIAVLAIALTAVLFTSIFTIGGNMLYTNTENSLIQVGTRTHGGFKNFTWEEYETLAKDEKIRDLSYNIIVGFTTNEKLNKIQGEVRYFEELNARNSFAWPTTGKLPQKEDEAAMSSLILDALGVPCKLGEKVTLEMNIHGKIVTKTFTLCGFWEGSEVAGAQEVAVSKVYCNQVAPLETRYYYEKKGTDVNDHSGYMNPSFNFFNSWDIETKMEKLCERCGFDTAKVNYGVNWVYGLSSVDGGTIFLIAVVLLVILLSGYLIIYNIFYLNVYSDIRFYGLLKTIGTTGRQLRRIVYRQAWYLCLVGIPIGLVVGWFIGRVLTPVIVSILVLGDTKYTVSPWLFFGAAVFAWLTVFISCVRPCKIASKVSPVEAVKYTGNQNKSRRAWRKVRRRHNQENNQEVFKKAAKATDKMPVQRKSNSLFHMAAANLKRNPRKAVLVVCSCALSMIILNSTYTIVTSFDMDKFLRNSICTDFSVTDATIGTFTGRASVYDGVTEEFQKELEQQKGITDVGNVYLYPSYHQANSKEWERIESILDASQFADFFAEPMLEESLNLIRQEKKLDLQIYAVDEFASRFLQIYDGEFDWEKFNSGEYILVNGFDGDSDEEDGRITFNDVGDTVTVEFRNGKTKDYKVLALGSIPYAIGARSTTLMRLQYVLPAKELIEQSGGQQPLRTIFNVKEESKETITAWLENYTEKVNRDMAYDSKETYLNEFQQLQRVYLIVGGVLSFILALIGILNFINVMITSILSRRQELAMMESIGMTGYQQKRMLQYEGLIYGILTMAVSCTLGMLIGYGIMQLLVGQMEIFSWHITVLPLVICLPILFLISIIVPVLCYQKICARSSVVERLRIVE